MKKLILGALFSTLLAVSADATPVSPALLINIYDPSHVVITSTGANSTINVSGSSGFVMGISFLNFFTSNQSIPEAAPVAISGNWRGAGTTTSYNSMVTYVYNNPAVQPGVDLSIYSDPTSSTQNFMTTAAAFSGSSTVNLSAFASALPAAGTIGTITIGYQASQGGAIGSWQVISVPEPSTYAVFTGIFALIGVMVYRRPGSRAANA